jgi:membrane-bound metal-dependent hydrolase YbcI (DUF457 family)
MAQGGLHALIGTVIVKATGKDAAEPGRAVAAKSFAFGFVTGNVLPDVDLAALALVYFFDRDLALKMHRTATHSLVVIALFTTIGLLFSTTRGGRSFFQGLGTGMVLHVLFDVLMWFSAVDILWPLGRFGIPSEVNLWTWFSLPRLWLDLLGSADFLLMALFYQYLLGRGRMYGTNVRFLPALRSFMLLHLALFAAFAGLPFFLSADMFEIVHYDAIVLLTLPMTAVAVIRARPTIERLAVASIDYRWGEQAY